MLDDKTFSLARGANFAVLTTLLGDGTPQSHVMWIDCDDDHLLVNTEVHRTKFANLERDPRATITIMDHDDPYSFVEVRGHVVEKVMGPAARDHIDQLSVKYLGRKYSNAIQSERVILKVAADRQYLH